ncbi:MAG: 1-acyl-sn-glycerol-3-phosphate acyltransferase [Oscillospiraceae bacterium]|nr:1-acyl-sn-glycerol-3-phosphate acyltransferase [Oscillospiraceae bacterium]
MKPSYKFYRGCYRVARAWFGILYRLRVDGADNIPSGAAVVCANHSHMSDPFLAAFAFGISNQLHVIAKIELFRIPVISQILQKLGMICVNRGKLDIDSVKSSLQYLRKGEMVVIFPEGTRVSADDAVEAKAGAVKLAERAGALLVPFYIPRKKRLFRKVTVVIGEPYSVEKLQVKRTADDYAELSEALMEKIKSLNPEVNA